MRKIILPYMRSSPIKSVNLAKRLNKDAVGALSGLVVWAQPGVPGHEIVMKAYPSYGFIMIACQIVDFEVFWNVVDDGTGMDVIFSMNSYR